MTTPEYSIVIPTFNEASNLAQLSENLIELMERLDGPCEVIFVDDGSTDKSFAKMMEIRGADPRFKIIRLSRNFGQQCALTAGMEASLGRAVITMDADLQHPVETVLEMALAWKKGFDIVYGMKLFDKKESVMKRWTAKVFYWVLKKLSSSDMPIHVGDFRLVDRKVIEVVRQFPEKNRYLRGLYSWIGFRQLGIPYHCEKRFSGDSKYSWTKMIRLALDGIAGFSDKPMKFSFFTGLGLFLLVPLTFALLLILVPDEKQSLVWNFSIFLLLFLCSLQFCFLGTMGIYLLRVHEQVLGRPIFIISETVGIERFTRDSNRVHHLQSL